MREKKKEEEEDKWWMAINNERIGSAHEEGEQP